MRPLFNTLIVAMICAVAAEVAGIIYSIGFRDVDYKAATIERQALLRDVGQTSRSSTSQHPQLLSVVVNGIPRKLHPYFGYTLESDGEHTNNHGFPTKIEFPHQSEKDEFVVGIFGGSVAIGQCGGNAGRVLKGGIQSLVSNNGFTNTTLLCFANGGWRQPQTFFALVYYLETVDMIIVLDGFNDVAQLKPANGRDWPARYPWESIYRPLSAPAFSPNKIQAIGMISVLENRLGFWTSTVNTTILRYSLLAHSVWRIWSRSVIAETREYEQTVFAIEEKTAATKTQKTSNDYEWTADDYYNFYMRLSYLQSRLSAEFDLPYFHFIQPNQYVRDSKPYSDRELSEYLSLGHRQTEKITSRYSKLERDVVNVLKRKGVSIHSLTGAFSKIKETVYRDNCCHLNEFGRKILAEEILSILRLSFTKNNNNQLMHGDVIVSKRALPNNL